MFTVIFDFYLRELGPVSIPQDIYSFKVNLVFWAKIRTVLCCCHESASSTLTVLATGGPSSPQERGRDSCLRAVLCYRRLFTKACMGCKWFFLKKRTNVMFLDKIDLPYCLVVFFVVCRRLRPFGSGVFGELALFWCSVYIPYKPMSSVMGSCLCK